MKHYNFLENQRCVWLIFLQYFQEKEQATTSEDNSRTPMDQHEHEWLQTLESSYETKNNHKDPTDSSETT